MLTLTFVSFLSAEARCFSDLLSCMLVLVRISPRPSMAASRFCWLIFSSVNFLILLMSSGSKTIELARTLTVTARPIFGLAGGLESISNYRYF